MAYTQLHAVNKVASGYVGYSLTFLHESATGVHAVEQLVVRPVNKQASQTIGPPTALLHLELRNPNPTPSSLYSGSSQII